MATFQRIIEVVVEAEDEAFVARLFKRLDTTLSEFSDSLDGKPVSFAIVRNDKGASLVGPDKWPLKAGDVVQTGRGGHTAVVGEPMEPQDFKSGTSSSDPHTWVVCYVADPTASWSLPSEDALFDWLEENQGGGSISVSANRGENWVDVTDLKNAMEVENCSALDAFGLITGAGV